MTTLWPKLSREEAECLAVHVAHENSLARKFHNLTAHIDHFDRALARYLAGFPKGGGT